MLNTEQTQQLAARLQQQCQLLDQLLDVLEQERALIETRDAEQLSLLLPTKNQLLQQLDALHRELQHWLSASGLPREPAGIEQLIRSAPLPQDGPALPLQWRALKHKSRRCQHANSVNGQLIRQGHERTRRLINLLLGREEQTAVYDQGGMPLQQQSSRRSLGSV